jgi:hypothetical protein
VKKNLLLAGIIGILLVFGMVIVGCPVDSNDDPGEDPDPFPSELKGSWCLETAPNVVVFTIRIEDDCGYYTPATGTKEYELSIDDKKKITYERDDDYFVGEATLCTSYSYDSVTKVLTFTGELGGKYTIKPAT